MTQIISELLSKVQLFQNYILGFPHTDLMIKRKNTLNEVVTRVSIDTVLTKKYPMCIR